jgi:hypothetical protein
MPDDLPQWRCHANIRNLPVGLDFIADQASVVDIEAQVPAGSDPGAAKAVFDDLVAKMEAFPSAHSLLTSWIGTWSGDIGQVAMEFPGGRAAIESDATWIGLYLSREPRFAPSATAR